MTIVAGDIGGTKSNLALFAQQGPKLELVNEQTYQSDSYSSLQELVKEFLNKSASHIGGDGLRAGCFGIACPVVGDGCKTPNLPWTVSAQAIRDAVGIDHISLINDLEASGYGLSLLEENEYVVLQEGSAQPGGNAALVSAGTGLGEALLYQQGNDFTPVASEGGHSDFAPRNQLEIELLTYLLARYPKHVSYERVISGPGLFNIYCFLRDSGYGEEPSWLADRLQQGDPSPTISAVGLAGESQLCVRALDLFVSIYGAEAGNVALTLKATNGVFVGGGIAPKLIEKLQDGTFTTAFCGKGRLSSLMEKIPVRVILNPRTALLGAARYATFVG